jgi:lipoprotein-anchoring transpeptidase ErfK/SrfK
MNVNVKTLAIAATLAAAPYSTLARDMVSLSVPDQVPSNIFDGPRSRDILVAQVLLDRSRHSPGVIDGLPGGNTSRAIRAFERANGLKADGKIDPQLLKKLLAMSNGDILQRYTITEADVSGPFHDVPSGMEGKAKLEKLTYESPAEALAEKFHMAQSFLKALNPNVDFGKAGTEITVVVPGDERMEGKVARVEVDKAASALRAYDEGGTLVATYPATIGSSTFPSPSGSMEVRAIAPAPKYYFSPEGREWGPDRKLTIAAGPNNPVGSTWIDLTKEGYGIHGTPDPKLIGKTSSHGCVRLTNWDAEELSRAVSKGTKVEFV